MFNTPIILRDKYILLIFAASAVILVIAAATAFINLSGANNLLVIHFDSYKGVDFFGEKYDVFEIVFTAMAIFLINLFLTNEFYSREKFLSYIFAVNTLIVSILISIAVNAIISIN